MYAEKRANEDSHPESKKIRTENDPSPVLHARNLPDDCTEMELIVLGQSFGRIVNVLMLKGKTQAFIEMESAPVATQMLNVYTQSPPYVRNRPIYFQYSKHQHISNPTLSSSDPANGLTAGVGSVLHVEVHNMYYQINLDTIHQVFSKYGSIARIVTFTKNGLFQALVEFTDQANAVSAKTMLDGQNLYTQCCNLKIQMSKLEKISVKYNSEKSRDFTQNLPSGEGGMPQHQPLGGPQQMGGMNAYGQPMPPQVGFQGQQGYGGVPGYQQGSQSCVLCINNLDEELCTPDLLFTLIGVYADVQRVKIMYNKKDSALVQVSDQQQAALAKTHLEGVKLHGKELHLSLSKHNEVKVSRSENAENLLTKDYSNSPLHRFRRAGSRNFQNIAYPSCTLHLSNIPEDTTEETIREVAGKASEVVKFRFLPQKEKVGQPEQKNDRKMALIELASTEEAIKVLLEMHNLKIEDKLNLRVSFSKSEV